MKVLLAWCSLFGVACFAQPRVVFGSEYACNNGDTRFIVNACKMVYTFESCEVQYLNAAAPKGLGAKVDIRREMLEASLKNCTVAGKAVSNAPAPAGVRGQAQWLGTWYDVTILERQGGKARVRWSSGTEDWMDVSSVRGTAAPLSTGGSLDTVPDGRYTCMGIVGRTAMNFGFVEIKGSTYRGASLHPSGRFAPFAISRSGEIRWSQGFGEFNSNGVQYQSAKVMPGDKPRFQVMYKLASGRTDAVDCGRE